MKVSGGFICDECGKLKDSDEEDAILAEICLDCGSDIGVD